MRPDIPDLLRRLATELEIEDFHRQRAHALNMKGLITETVDAADTAKEAHRRSLALRETLRRYNFIL